MINRSRFAVSAAVRSEYSARTLDIVRESTVIDMLGLLTLDYRRLVSWELNPARFPALEAQRLLDSGITILHPAVGYIDGDIAASSLQDLQGWNTLISSQPHLFQRIDKPADLAHCKASGKIGIVLGLQNSSHFQTVQDVDRFYALGQRVSQLTYRNNRLGSGSADSHDGGLTPYGVEIVARMNQRGMAIDISHCADRTTLDAIEASRSPVLATHSNCRAISAHRRCKTDEAIQKLAARGGVLGVTMVRSFVRLGGPATIQHVLDHIDHIVQLTGVEHVGLGTDVDLDGRDGARLPKYADLDNVNYSMKIFDITEGLVQRGYSNQAIQLILGGNFQRALESIW